MLAIIKKGGDDVTIDETTWANASYADVHGRLKGKKCEKGGQHMMVMDLRRRYLYVWMPRDTFFQREPPFTQEGPAEVKRLVDLMHPLMIGSPKNVNDKCWQIFNKQIHFAMDNHFSGGDVE